LGFWLNGQEKMAIASLEAAVSTCESAGLWSHAIPSATLLAELHWVSGNHAVAQSWLDRAGVALSRNAAGDFSEGFYATSLVIAVDQGRINEAEVFLAKAVQHAPRMSWGRNGLLGLGYRIRIDLAKGNIPTVSDTNALIEGLRRYQPYGLMDEVAEIAVAALEAHGLTAEAKAVGREYCQHRRERFASNRLRRVGIETGTEARPTD
jgi:hypothetical protein